MTLATLPGAASALRYDCADAERFNRNMQWYQMMAQPSWSARP